IKRLANAKTCHPNIIKLYGNSGVLYWELISGVSPFYNLMMKIMEIANND
ncbi:21786_t:CDS:2, partial [Racocetra persica]